MVGIMKSLNPKQSSRRVSAWCLWLLAAVLALPSIVVAEEDWQDIPPVLPARRLSGRGATTTWYVSSRSAVDARLERIYCRSRLLANRLKHTIYHSTAWAEITGGPQKGLFKIALSRSALGDIDRQAFIDTHLMGHKRLQQRHKAGRFVSGSPLEHHQVSRIHYRHVSVEPSDFQGPCPSAVVSPDGADDASTALNKNRPGFTASDTLNRPSPYTADGLEKSAEARGEFKLVRFTDGRVIRVAAAWREGGMVKCRRFGSVVSYPADQVAAILDPPGSEPQVKSD